MNSQERVFDELNRTIGTWSAVNSSAVAEFPSDPVPSWPEVDEDEFPARSVQSESRRDDDTSDISATDDSENTAISEAVTNQGLDALAFYKSFRYRHLKPYAGKWGIFYFDAALAFVARLQRAYLPNGASISSTFALKFIQQHEQHHFRIDVLALMIEPTLKTHLYLPYRHAYTLCQSHCVEEALANAAAWKFAKREDKAYPGYASFAEEFLSGQPNAYSRYAEPENLLAAELAENLVHQRFGRYSSPTLSEWVLQSSKIIPARLTPEYRISSNRASTLFPAAKIYPSILAIRESKRVQK